MAEVRLFQLDSSDGSSHAGIRGEYTISGDGGTAILNASIVLFATWGNSAQPTYHPRAGVAKILSSGFPYSGIGEGTIDVSLNGRHVQRDVKAEAIATGPNHTETKVLHTFDALTIAKTYVSQTISISAATSSGVVYASVTNHGEPEKQWRGVSYANHITIPPKDTYTISYYAHDGANAPPSQTKWYGEDLPLQSGTPNKDGYTFKGWATSLARANAGYVDYTPGATYKANSNLNLFAVWELIYSKPTITEVKAERCLEDGRLEDESGYAKVTFTWSIFKSSLPRYYGDATDPAEKTPYKDNHVSSCTVKVGNRTKTVSLSGESGTIPVVVGNGSYGTDTSYPVTITITDSQTVVSDHTTIVTDTLPTTFFPMDFNDTASAVGFFMPAPNEVDGGNGAYFGKDIIVKEKNDIKIELDSHATSGTDHDILQALENLEWTDVLS